MATAVIPRRSVGRPRSQASRLAILDTAYEHLKSRPIAAISPLHIANEAGVSSATVYRWWSTKEALLLDAALYKIEEDLVLKNEGRPMDRLKGYVLQVGKIFTGENGIVVARIVTAIQDNPTLRREFLRRIYTPKDKEVRIVVDEAIALGELPVEMEVSTFLDSIYGPLLARLLIRHEEIDDAFVVRVFDTVVAGIRQLN